MSVPSPSSALEFLRIVGLLKRTLRTGWVHSNVAAPESVAAHMYRMGVMAFLVRDADAGVSYERVMKIALVHDLAEALVGDITPHCGVSAEEKFRRERDAMVRIRSTLADAPRVGEEIEALWLEYEEQSSPEARYVKDFDKFDMVLQADEYEQEQPAVHLDSFFASTAGKFGTSVVQGWDAELRARRDARLAAASNNGKGDDNGTSNKTAGDNSTSASADATTTTTNAP